LGIRIGANVSPGVSPCPLGGCHSGSRSRTIENSRGRRKTSFRKTSFKDETATTRPAMAMTDQDYRAIGQTLERYQSLDELKELIRRHGRGPVRTAAHQHFAGFSAKRARVQADLTLAADDIDAEEMTL